MTCFLSFLLIIMISYVTPNQGYHEIVNVLQDYVETNPDFAQQLTWMFIEADATNTTYNDMYEFFDKWITIAQNITIFDEFTQTLYRFGIQTSNGTDIFSSNIGQQWFMNYTKVRKLFHDSPNSSYIIPAWESWNAINMSLYKIPPNGFQNFNEFFSRKIYSKYRPIASPNNRSVITSPTDGSIFNITKNLQLNETQTIKNVKYNIYNMLENKTMADIFENGTLINIYLQPYNYHRFHSAVDGIICDSVEMIDGYILYTPTEISMIPYESNVWWTQNNVRKVVYVENPIFGTVAHVFVGIWLIDSVQIEKQRGDSISKGEEIGYFMYGGSSVVLLFEEGVIDKVLVDINQNITFGEAIAVSSSSDHDEMILW
eukprot:307873_1